MIKNSSVNTRLVYRKVRPNISTLNEIYYCLELIVLKTEKQLLTIDLETRK